MAEQTATGVIADGRVIHTPSGPCRPGDVFEAEPAEVQRLRRLGYLVDPRRVIIDGPRGVKLVVKKTT